MKLGDRIVAINSTTINDFIDVKMALMDAAPDDQVRALVLRQEGDQEISLPLQLSLVDPPAEPH
jgi:S1-C subfamily serine protease